MFNRPLILNEKANIHELNNLYNIKKQNYLIKKSETTQEQLEEIYNSMNKIKYCNSENNDEYINSSDQIHEQIKQMANVQVDNTLSNFLNEIIIKNNINHNHSMNLINYHRYKIITNNSSGKMYDPYNNNNNNNNCDFNCLLKNVLQMEEFVDNFNVEEFFEWVKWNEKKHNELKKIENFKLEFDDKITERNEQNILIVNNIEAKLKYYANKEFTLPEIWDECNYNNYLNNSLINL